eukprot:Tamp_22910.p2 GENE.Tamp_22910~~Tamp_22910.p2  ORF type:complete len:187 (-),score=20.62 Tamp_22910:124-684(-)
MLDVDALERLRDEVTIKDCELQRLLRWYGPVGHALGQYEYCRDESGEKQQEDLEWFSALPEHRREAIQARKEALEIWHLELVHLPSWERINMRQAWLELESVLSIVLPTTDVIQMIWNYVLDGKNENDLSRWRTRMTMHLPSYPIPPPYSYLLTRKTRWKVWCRWKHLIKYKFGQNAPTEIKNDVM